METGTIELIAIRVNCIPHVALIGDCCALQTAGKAISGLIAITGRLTGIDRENGANRAYCVFRGNSNPKEVEYGNWNGRTRKVGI